MTVRVRDFILSDSHAMWNHAVRGLLRPFHDPHYYPQEHIEHIINYVWQKPPLANPGFVIAACDMMELLEDPEMQLKIHLSDLNGERDTLFYVSVKISKRQTLLRLLEVCPEEVPWDGLFGVLQHAVQRRQPEAVERLLESCRGKRRNDPCYGQCITMALREALHSINPNFVPNEISYADYAPTLDIIRQLLVHGANLFAADKFNRGMMHDARLLSAQQLLIDHAKRLEVEGLRGSVQRLLRHRDVWGQTPGTTPYLDDALIQALKRDSGQPMYDFDNIDIPALRDGTIRKADLMEYSLERYYCIDNSVWETAYRDYREWLARRSLELKRQYISERRKIATMFHANSLVQELPDEWDDTELHVS